MFSRVKPSNYPVGGTVKSTELNQLDIDHSNSLDKTNGDVLVGPILSHSDFTIASDGYVNFDGYCTIEADGHFEAKAGASVLIDGACTISAPTITGAATITGSLTMSGTENVQLASRSISRMCQNPAVFADDTVWVRTGSLAAGEAKTTDDTLDGGNEAIIELDIPNGAVLTSATCYYVPPGSHSGLPAVLPGLTLTSLTMTGNVNTTIASHQDTFGSIAAYEANRSISLTGLSTTIDRTGIRYFIVFTAESSTNALPNSQYWGVKWTATITNYDEG